MRLRLLVHGVIALGFLAFVAGFAQLSDGGRPALWAIALAAVVFLLGDTALLHIRFGHDQHSFTWSEVALVVGLVLLPPPWVWLVAPIPVAIAHLVARRDPLKVAFNAGAIGVGMVLASMVNSRFSPEGTLSAAEPRAWAALALGSLTFFVWNGVTVSAAVAFSQGLSFGRVYRKGLLLNLLVWLGNTSAGILLVAMAASQPATLLVLPVVVGLLYAAYRSYLQAMQERDTWQTLQETTSLLVGADSSEFAQVVLDAGPELFSAEFIELVLTSDSGEVAVFRRRGDQSDPPIYGQAQEVLGPWWDDVRAEAGCFDITAAGSPPRQRAEFDGLGLASCLVAPLWSHNRHLGSLRIGFRGRVALMRRDRQVFKTFANHVSAAAENLRLFEQMRTQALHDPLTGLPNRTLLLDRLKLAQARAGRRPYRVAVLFIDVDRFKVINDSLGHDSGDKLLIEVAHRLTQILRPGDTAARFGGDEFVVLCEDIGDAEQALDIADRISAALSAPIAIDGDEVVITVSTGVAVATGPDQAPMALLRDADAAMYRAKERGRARCELFDKTVRAQAVARLEMENELRHAIERGELQLHYQPNVRVSDIAVVGAEALVRWNHPTRGVIAPVDFIGLAEETGLILPLGALVLDEACRQVAEWAAAPAGLPDDFYVSVNLSTRQLVDPNLLHRVSRAILQSGIPARALCLEITETALLEDAEDALDVLRKLRGLGLRIALDDFGTGYSAFSYLHLLPVDVLKIDRSFVSRLGPDARDLAIVEGMIELAHALDLTVVAEGVETQAQLNDLRAVGCDVAQGYLVAPPAAPEDIVGLLTATPFPLAGDYSLPVAG